MILEAIVVCYLALISSSSYAISMDGFSVDLIRRDSPRSPYYVPNVSPSLQRSRSRSSSLFKAIVENKSVASMLAYGQFLIGIPRQKTVAVGRIHYRKQSRNLDPYFFHKPKIASTYKEDYSDGESFSHFSYCLVPYGSPRISKLHFGAHAAILGVGAGVSWTPINRKTPGDFYYYLTLEAISIGGKRLEYPQAALSVGLGNMAIDTGMTLTHLEPKFYDRLVDALAAEVKTTRAVRHLEEWRLCYYEEDYPVFPEMTVHFKGADVGWSSKHAFVIVEEYETRYLCLAVVPTTGFPIYGTIAQADYMVEYDLMHSTVSFKSTLCGL